MPSTSQRIVTGHDAHGKSVVLQSAWPAQHHPMQGPSVGADFHELWREESAVPALSPVPADEPTTRPFTLMPASGHLLRILEVFPLGQGGFRTPMHRTRTLDYVVVIEGELVLVLEDSEVALRAGDVVVQRGTDHAWENRSDRVARAAFFHIAAEFDAELARRLPASVEITG